LSSLPQWDAIAVQLEDGSGDDRLDRVLGVTCGLELKLAKAPG
jgi:hypothetical protein